jgi:serine phosphatase RsbU (regulator of sigma subunit)
MLQMAENTDNASLRLTALNNMGYDYARLEENQKACETFEKAYDTAIKMNVSDDQLAEILTNTSVCLFNLKRTREAIENLKKVLISGKSEMNPAMQAKTENLLATIYLYSGDLYNAGQFSKLAVESALKSRDKYILQNCYNTHSLVLKAGNDPIRALEYYEKYLSLRDSLLLEEKLSEQENARRKFDLEKSEKETRLEIADENMIEMRLIQSELERQRQRQQIDSLEQATRLTGLEFETERQAAALKLEQLIKNQAIQENERLRSDSIMQDLKIQIQNEQDRRRVEEINQLEREKKQEQIVKRRAIYIAALLVIVAVSILSGLLVTRKKNTLLASQKAEIQEKNFHLEQLNEEITAQKEMIEEKNTSITASITYAEKIQSAVLPPDDFFKENLSDYFIFFRPRDIVSGDFYWGANKNGRLVIVAADCTGHGVPGAFMSMLGTAFLNEIVADMEYPESHRILDQLRRNVIEAMRQTGEEGEAKDGMDIALCVLDSKKMKLQYSGAFNPLYYIKNNELLLIKADRMPIGIHQIQSAGFTKNDLELKPGECFYLFSDGFADQFGGPEGKKFKNKAFQELLLANHHKSMTEQKRLLEETFDEWKKDFDQIDDVLVMGVRV